MINETNGLSLIVRVRDMISDMPIDGADVVLTRGAFKVKARTVEGRAAFTCLDDGFYVLEAGVEGGHSSVLNLGLTSDCNILMHVQEGGWEHGEGKDDPKQL